MGVFLTLHNPRNLTDQEKSTKQGFPSPTCCTKLLWCPDFMSRSFHCPAGVLDRATYLKIERTPCQMP
jgi:hypothetical protein